MRPFPRPTRFLHLVLLALGGALGHVVWVWTDFSLTAYLSGTAAPFCMLCAGAVWALRDKAEDRLIPSGADSVELGRALKVVATLRRQFAPLAARTAVLALFAAGPATSAQLANVIWQWSVYAAGLAVSEAAFAYLRATAWDEQLRAERDRRAVEALRDAERNAMLQRLYPAPDDQAVVGDWTPSQQALVQTGGPH